MSFDNKYTHRKDWRSPYYHRCHTAWNCSTCIDDKRYNTRKRLYTTKEMLENWEDDYQYEREQQLDWLVESCFEDDVI